MFLESKCPINFEAACKDAFMLEELFVSVGSRLSFFNF